MATRKDARWLNLLSEAQVGLNVLKILYLQPVYYYLTMMESCDLRVRYMLLVFETGSIFKVRLIAMSEVADSI